MVDTDMPAVEHIPGELDKIEAGVERVTAALREKSCTGDAEGAGEQTLSSGPSLRTFASGAARDTDKGKLDYEGFLAAITKKRFAEYMHKNRNVGQCEQFPNGFRPSDNWQLGLDPKETLKSLIRHVEDVHLIIDGWPEEARESLQDALCAIIFNAQALLLDDLKQTRRAATCEARCAC